MSLNELMKKYNSNKEWHGYCSFYESLFENKKMAVKHFFEIGISTGASLLAWKEYFQNSQVYGIDLVIPDSVKGVSRIQYAVADQSSENALEKTVNDWGNPIFDCILDDGGHCVKQQRISIETLWKYVSNGGYYIIEDLHTNIRYFHLNHPHMNENSKFIDETPTVHHKIIKLMEGDMSVFPFSNEIESIVYYMNPTTKSLSCAFKKKLKV